MRIGPVFKTNARQIKRRPRPPLQTVSRAGSALHRKNPPQRQMERLDMPANTPLGYTGQFRDPVFAGYPMGNGHRVYLPSLMRFSSPDVMSPFGKGGTNPYAYCAGDPIDRADPSGNFSVFSVLGAALAVGGLALGIHNSVKAWSMAASALGEGGEGLLSRTGGMAAAHAAGAVSAFSAAKLGVTLTFTASMGGPHQFRRNMRLFGAGIGMTIAGVAPLALKKRTLSNDRVRLLGAEERVQIDMEDIHPETSTSTGHPPATTLVERAYDVRRAAANALNIVQDGINRAVRTTRGYRPQIDELNTHELHTSSYLGPSTSSAPAHNDAVYGRPLVYDSNFSLGDDGEDEL
jgi:RHS repeat-associated protein